MQIINSYGYINVIVSVIILGLIIDIIIHLAKQMKNTCEWRIDFSSLGIRFAVWRGILCQEKQLSRHSRILS